ncbi:MULTISPECIES: hypothetical protein [Mycobacterium]|uniref:Uncharacterized protein n=2 Tax=Mycobacterium TaxID=1763 RepID=D5P2J9_9MYCO|nr:MULTISPECIES: hypothetical protein [Mycobacterium]EFG79686.1 hypothetical protein HMPREF0591_0393 [Mycobacterium parascrofulaceum ATCC BAA-614]
MDEDLMPRAFVAQVLARHLRLPAGWDDAERQEFIDDAAEQVAARVAELADDWAERAVTEWGRQNWRLPDYETQVELVQQARTSALVMVLCDVLPDVPVAELYTQPGAYAGADD